MRRFELVLFLVPVLSGLNVGCGDAGGILHDPDVGVELQPPDEAKFDVSRQASRLSTFQWMHHRTYPVGARSFRERIRAS